MTFELRTHGLLDLPRIELSEPAVGEIEHSELRQVQRASSRLELAEPYCAHLLHRVSEAVPLLRGSAARQREKRDLVACLPLLCHRERRPERLIVGMREDVEDAHGAGLPGQTQGSSYDGP